VIRRIRNILRLATAMSIGGLVIAGVTVGAASTASASSSITIRGGVSCSHYPVEGVWIQSSNGGSTFASWSKASPAGLSAAFSASITVSGLPTDIQLHVGCNGSTSSWWSDNWTPSTSVNGSVILDATCNEGTSQPPAGANSRCAYQSVGATIVNAAKSMSGDHYCYDGGTPTGPSHGSGNYAGLAPDCSNSSTVGFDCTGLTLFSVFHATDITLPHNGTQATVGGGTLIKSISSLQPGDIIFFGGTLQNFLHAGIYAGNGYMWDSNTPYWIYGDGVQERLVSAETSDPTYHFDGAIRF
jgi:cell wall-associated NlpC family hydrolase